MAKVKSQPTIEDPKPKNPPKDPPVEPVEPKLTPDLSSIYDLLTEMKARDEGFLSQIASAAEINGKLDEMTAFIKDNPAATVKDTMESFKKMFTAESEEPETDDKPQRSLADAIFHGLTLGQFDK